MFVPRDSQNLRVLIQTFFKRRKNTYKVGYKYEMICQNHLSANVLNSVSVDAGPYLPDAKIGLSTRA